MAKRTPLFPCYQQAGARIVEFHGWDLPVSFSGILNEHRAVREKAGLFDVSHMGELLVTGPDALEAVGKLITNDVDGIVDGKALYTPMCLPTGGIVDDMIVCRYSPEKLFLVVNAANVEKDYRWVADNISGRSEVKNVSGDYAQLALQGPLAKQILVEAGIDPPIALKFFQFEPRADIGSVPCLVSRTGYTGENGFEIYIDIAQHGEAAVRTVWTAIMEAGEPLGLVPVGLGARDTLRFEACLMLYGNEIDETTSPLEAGIDWAIKFDHGDFIGKEPLLKQRETGVTRKLAGLKVDRCVPRPGYPVAYDGHEVGRVTSGTFAPLLKQNLALTYLPVELAAEGTVLEVERRGRQYRAEVVKIPFYKRKRKKKKKK
ncbi:MAG: glycine cleavage system aminomethyltransferase GcvT [bacterium]|nr:glycine cleavage system aminomethyltransferase GcvT [bacterium]